jgi:hypothetical protein
MDGDHANQGDPAGNIHSKRPFRLRALSRSRRCGLDCGGLGSVGFPLHTNAHGETSVTP